MEGSTVATHCGQQVIIGGMRGGSPVNSIHQLADGQWMNIGSMSSYRLVASPSPDNNYYGGGRRIYTWGTQLDSVEVRVAE